MTTNKMATQSTTTNPTKTELAVHPAGALSIGRGGIEIKTVEDLRSFCHAIKDSQALKKEDKNSPGAMMLKIQLGLELGLPPTAALRGVYVVPGADKPSLETDTMKAIVWASGLMGKFESHCEGEGEKMCGVCTATRKDRNETRTERFTWEMAKRAQLLGKNNWKEYPEDMFLKRAESRVLRRLFPDVLLGMLSVDEARDAAEPQDAEFTVKDEEPLQGEIDPFTALNAGDEAVSEEAGGVVDNSALVDLENLFADATYEQERAIAWTAARKAFNQGAIEGEDWLGLVKKFGPEIGG